MNIFDHAQARHSLVMPSTKRGATRVIRCPLRGYLLRPVDAWGKVAPEWVADPFTAYGFTINEAIAQCNLLHWDHKIKTEWVPRATAPVHNSESTQ